MTAIEIRPLTAQIGAEIRGVDLRRPTDDDVDAISKALVDHLALFFRDQPLTPDEHLALARRFGTINVAPFGPKEPDHPEITVLDQIAPQGEGADSWHSDNSFMAEPPLGSILRAVQLPPVGGDTCFSSMYAAYDALSPAFRQLLDGLTAVHDLIKMLRRAISNRQSDADVDEMQRQWPPREHPVARTHPDSGRKALYVNGNFTTRICGLTGSESDLLLGFLIGHVRSPDFQCRFHWEPDSVAFWDNRVVQHYAVPDYTERRIMHRVTLDGEAPF